MGEDSTGSGRWGCAGAPSARGRTGLGGAQRSARVQGDAFCAPLPVSPPQCVPQESRGFVLGQYECRCKPGFYGAGGVAVGTRAGGCSTQLGAPLSPCSPCRCCRGFGIPNRGVLGASPTPGSIPRRGGERGAGGWGSPAGVPTLPRGMRQLRGRHPLPDPGGPGAAGGHPVLPGLLHAGRVPQHAGLLPLPQEQGKRHLGCARTPRCCSSRPVSPHPAASCRGALEGGGPGVGVPALGSIPPSTLGLPAVPSRGPVPAEDPGVRSRPAGDHPLRLPPALLPREYPAPR